MYLVVIRHSMDDIPLMLTADEDEALKFAKKVKPGDGMAEKKVLGIDATTPVCVAVYLFLAGKLNGMRVVKHF